MTGSACLIVPSRTGHVVAGEVLRYGRLGMETGGFLLAPHGTSSVSVVAFVGMSGVVRSRFRLQISDLALDQLFGFAEQQQCWIPAQFHSHADLAFLSQTDREHGLRVQGFVSAVIPDFAAPPRHVTDWSWWCFDTDDWLTTCSPSTGHGRLRQVIFDEDGVRDS